MAEPPPFSTAEVPCREPNGALRGKERVPLWSPFRLRPLPDLEPQRAHGSKARARRAAAVRRHSDINACIDSLNWLAGHRKTASVFAGDSSDVTGAEAALRARITTCIDKQLVGEDAIPSPEAAFRGLLKGRNGYDRSGFISLAATATRN